MPSIRGGGLDWRHTATKTSPDLNVPAKDGKVRYFPRRPLDARLQRRLFGK